MRARFTVVAVPVVILLGWGVLEWGGGARLFTAAASDAKATPGDDSGLIEFLDGAIRIDGKDVKSERRLVATLEGGGGGGDGDSQSLTAPTANVLMDAWTQKITSGQTDEDYDFVVGDIVRLVVFVKVGEGGMPGGAAMDFVLVPGGVNRMPPIPAPSLFIDDVYFDPIEPGSVRLYVFTMDIQNLHTVFPPPMVLDWFAVADFNATSNADVDSNGWPDCCVEQQPARFLELSSPDVDNVGANVIKFFNPGRIPLNIFPPHPPNPAPKAIGGMPGEDGETRPWVFTLQG